MKKIARIGIVLVIIVLFVGASVVSGIGNNLSRINVQKFDNVEDENGEIDNNEFVKQSDRIDDQIVYDNAPQPLDIVYWWNTDWLYRKQITIDHTLVSDDLVNFPVLVSNTSVDFALNAQPDGDDFLFTSNDSSIQYNHEIEYYDNTTGELVAWVNVTSINATEDTVLWIYYGNEYYDSQENVAGTWDINYLGVFHLNEYENEICIDSTMYHNNGTYVGDLPNGIFGKIGISQDLDGGGDYISLPSNCHVDQKGTVELWSKKYPGSDSGAYYYNRNSVQSSFTQLYLWNNVLTSRAEWHGSEQWQHTSGSPGDDDVYFAQAWYTDQVLLKNDVLFSDSSVSMSSYDFDVFNIGANYFPGNYFKGELDEVRISDIRRTNDWLITSFNNQNNPDSFLTIGDEELGQFFIFVDDNYNETTPGWQINHFDSIQDGVDAVTENGTVYVYNGTYYENVVVNKTINLVGEDMNTTIIDGGGMGITIQSTNVEVNTLGITNYDTGILVTGDNCEINYIKAYDGYKSMEVQDVSNTIITDCNLSGNSNIGITIKRSPYTLLENCLIDDNSGLGINFVSSDNTTISNNTISNNGALGGLRIRTVDASYNNLIYHNNFIQNGINAYDECSNIWYNSTLHEGNYYDDYTGEDNNRDEIGDVPYNITGGSNQDLHPLMYPWGEMPPVANYTYSIQDLRVTFDPMNSYDRDGEIDYVTWDFGEPPFIQGPLGIVNHTYSSYGEYNVTLTVVDNDGYEGNITKTITLEDHVPPEITDHTQTIGYTGDSFTFNATLIDAGGIDTGWVEYWYDSGNHTNLSMESIVGNHWERIITINDTLETLYYIISANDTSNHWNNTGTMDVIIYDNDNPEITNINADMWIQIIERNVNLSGIITDNIEVDDVYLHIIYPDETEEYFSINQNKTGDTYYCNKTYEQVGTHSFFIWANDASNNEEISDEYTFEMRANIAPGIPIINGQTSGQAGESYPYSFVSVDPDDDDVYYYILWGDGEVEEWIGPYESDEIVMVEHTWEEQGAYTIMARTMDVWGAIGEWGTLEVTMPVNQHSIGSQSLLFQRIIMRFRDQVRQIL